VPPTILEQSVGGGAAWSPVAHIGGPPVTSLYSYGELPLSDVTTFRLVANGEPAPLYLDTYPVTPLPAQIISFMCYPATVGVGEANFLWQAVYCTGISLSADVVYWVSDPGTGGTTSVYSEHENLLQGGALMSTGDLTWTFYNHYNEFGAPGGPVSNIVTLVAYGFENAINNLMIYGSGVYGALEGIHVVSSGIGADNIRDADTPGGAQRSNDA